MSSNIRGSWISNEILARIVELVVGGQVLHVRLKRDPDHALYCWQREKCWVSRAQGFYLNPCVAQVLEQQAWEDFQSIHHPHGVPQGDSANYHVPAPHTRHLTCGSHHGLDCTDPAPPSPFSLFYVCSRLTKEAVRIFWTTNTFSIRSWPTFTVFLKSISEKSKAAIRAIDLDVDFHYELHDSFEPDDSFYNEQVDLIVYDDDDNEYFCVENGVERDFCVDVWPFRRLERKEKQELAKELYEILKSEKRQVLVGRDLRILETENLLRDLKAAQKRDWKAQRLDIQERLRTTVSSKSDACSSR